MAERYEVGKRNINGNTTRHGLDCPGIEFWWGARFLASVQTAPGAHPTSVVINGIKRWGRGVTHLPHLAPKVKKK